MNELMMGRWDGSGCSFSRTPISASTRRGARACGGGGEAPTSSRTTSALWRRRSRARPTSSSTAAICCIGAASPPSSSSAPSGPCVGSPTRESPSTSCPVITSGRASPTGSSPSTNGSTSSTRRGRSCTNGTACASRSAGSPIQGTCEKIFGVSSERRDSCRSGPTRGSSSCTTPSKARAWARETSRSETATTSFGRRTFPRGSPRSCPGTFTEPRR